MHRLSVVQVHSIAVIGSESAHVSVGRSCRRVIDLPFEQGLGIEFARFGPRQRRLEFRNRLGETGQRFFLDDKLVAVQTSIEIRTCARGEKAPLGKESEEEGMPDANATRFHDGERRLKTGDGVFNISQALQFKGSTV